MINNIKNNTISEADARTKLNALNEINKTEIKGKRLINGQKKLLNLFDLLEAIFNNNNASVNEDNNVNVNEDNNVSVNENDDVSVNEDNNVSANKSESESESENENGDDQYYVIKQLNNYFRTIDKTKLFDLKSK